MRPFNGRVGRPKGIPKNHGFIFLRVLASRWGFPTPPNGFPLKKRPSVHWWYVPSLPGFIPGGQQAGQGIPKGDILGPRPFWLGEETKKPKNQRHWAQMNSVTSNYFWMLHIFFGESSTKNSTVKTSPGAKKVDQVILQSSRRRKIQTQKSSTKKLLWHTLAF